MLSPARTLFTIRAGEGRFRIVTTSASEAMAHVAELAERGLDDVNVVDVNGDRYEVADLKRLADAEPAAGEQP